MPWSIRSIDRRLAELTRQYGLAEVDLKPGDTVLDVGANIGEFTMICQELKAKVHSFEPDPVEFSCLTRNTSFKEGAHQIALWHETGSLSFYLANDSGDSSLLDPLTPESQAISVQAETLDNWASTHLPPGQEIQLLKLEAEGAEPEILQGAVELLPRINYVSADVGRERPGKNGSVSTLPEVVTFLVNHGFSIVWLGQPRLVVVAKNNRLMTN